MRAVCIVSPILDRPMGQNIQYLTFADHAQYRDHLAYINRQCANTQLESEVYTHQ